MVDFAERLDQMLDRTVSRGATDLLLTTHSPVLMRLSGDLQRLDDVDARPLAPGDITGLLEVVLTEAQMEEFRAAGELDFSFGWRGEARVRGNCFFQKGEPALSLRVIPEKVPTLVEIGVPDIVREMMRLPQGLVLMTGPTGSGKSTTQAALIDWINDNRPVHILTLEDPIEYVHHHRRAAINQREIGTDSVSFATGLRAALREDPDVLLVGEMRDPESISITLTIAETGHLVLSTLHTNDASQALDRIVDVFPAERQAQVRVQLAGSLVAIVAQRLVPRIGGGMVAAFEVLLANHAVRNLIREGKTRQIRNVITMSQNEGMQTLEQSLSWLVNQGLVSYEAAVSRAMFPKEVAQANIPHTGAPVPVPTRASMPRA